MIGGIWPPGCTRATIILSIWERRVLFADFGADPEGAEEGEGDDQDEEAGGEADVEVGVGEVYGVVADDIPNQQG